MSKVIRYSNQKSVSNVKSNETQEIILGSIFLVLALLLGIGFFYALDSFMVNSGAIKQCHAGMLVQPAHCSKK